MKDAFGHKQHFFSVFFDLEKAYDRTWQNGILLRLQLIGLTGSMLNVIKDYLSDRTFCVREDNVLSGTFVQENGVPQWGVLSCAFFLVNNKFSKKCSPLNCLILHLC